MSRADGQSPDGRGRDARSTARCPRVPALGVRSRAIPIRRGETAAGQVVRDDELMAPGPGAGRHGPPPHRAEPVGRLRGRPRRRDRRRGRDRTARAGRTPRPPPGRRPATAPAARPPYVTLEPCYHHGSTPPCAEALDRGRASRASSSRSRIPTRASRARASRGCAAAGIDVDVGRRRRRGRRASLAPYLHHRRTGPRVRAAQDRDEPRRPHRGAPTARRSGSPAPRRRADAHALRADSQADRRRRRHRARRPAAAHRARRAADRSCASRCACCSTPRGRVPADGPLFDPDARADARVTTEPRPAPSATPGGPRAPRSRSSRRAATARGVDLDASARRCSASATACCRR